VAIEHWLFGPVIERSLATLAEQFSTYSIGSCPQRLVEA
jgi:hypothetical protein